MEAASMRVAEVFTSIQGEGPEAGRRALFIRFSGCNLSCQWCDSKYALHTYIETSINEILKLVERSGCKYIVLTGGEPTIQHDFNRLLDYLNDQCLQVDVETNGTTLPTGKLRENVRYIVSPKELFVANNWLTYKDECPGVPADFVFKFVIDLDTMDAQLSWIKKWCTEPVWLMPLTTNVRGHPDCVVREMITTGNIISQEMIKRGIDGYLCTRLQNLYRVR